MRRRVSTRFRSRKPAGLAAVSFIDGLSKLHLVQNYFVAVSDIH